MKKRAVFSGNATPVFASAADEFNVVPSDTVKQPEFKSLWVTTVGDIAVSRDQGATVIVYPSATITLGEFNIATPCFIMATGTTAVMIGQNW